MIMAGSHFGGLGLGLDFGSLLDPAGIFRSKDQPAADAGGAGGYVQCPQGMQPNPQWLSIPPAQRAQAAASGVQSCIPGGPGGAVDTSNLKLSVRFVTGGRAYPDFASALTAARATPTGGLIVRVHVLSQGKVVLRSSRDLAAAVSASGAVTTVGPGAPAGVIATNTSSLSITELAATSDRPARFLGMHFFNPVHRMRLVELVRGLETTDEALALGEKAAQAMGKETVLVRESPGFVTSRINVLIGNEAFTMLESGVASARDIDKALKLGLNHPMGPFELVDLVGLDTRLSILEYLHRTLGDKYRPSPLLIQYVKAGRLGRKVGRGVYEYPS
jgi:hypothetical protein